MPEGTVHINNDNITMEVYTRVGALCSHDRMNYATGEGSTPLPPFGVATPHGA